MPSDLRRAVTDLLDRGSEKSKNPSLNRTATAPKLTRLVKRVNTATTLDNVLLDEKATNRLSKLTEIVKKILNECAQGLSTGLENALKVINQKSKEHKFKKGSVVAKLEGFCLLTSGELTVLKKIPDNISVFTNSDQNRAHSFMEIVSIKSLDWFLPSTEWFFAVKSNSASIFSFPLDHLKVLEKNKEASENVLNLLLKINEKSQSREHFYMTRALHNLRLVTSGTSL
jgi:hypothetical protein